MAQFTLIGGTLSNDLLTGDVGADIIYGLDGNDRINAGSGDDIIDAGAGTNQIDAGDGQDIILIDGSASSGTTREPANGIDGGAGFDTVIYAGPAANYHVTQIAGGALQVTDLSTGARDIMLNVEHLQFADVDLYMTPGSTPPNLWLGTASADTLTGTDGADSLFGFAGNDRLNAGAGVDYIDAGSGTNQIDAGAGDDTIVAGQGTNGPMGVPANGIDGGAGYDTATFMSAARNFHLVQIAGGPMRVTNLTTGAVDLLVNVEHLQFTDSDQWLVPQPVNPPLVWGDVTGSVAEGAVATFDALSTAMDADTLDTLFVTNLAALPEGITFDTASQSFVVNAGGAVYDTLATGQAIELSVSYGITDGTHATAATALFTILGANDAAVISGTTTGAVTEDGTLTAIGQLTVTDVDHAEAQFRAIATPLAGQYGTLMMDSTGLWTYVLNNATTAVQSLGAGATLSDALTVYTVDGTAAQVNILITGAAEPLSGIIGTGAADTLNGTTGQDSIYGLTGDDKLYGRDGADLLDGGLGADSLYGGAGDDRVIYNAGDRVIDGGSNRDTLIVAGAVTANLGASDQISGDKAVVTGFEDIDASAAVVGVTLSGSSGSNTLTGGAGADIMTGGRGADILTGGIGADRFVFISTADSTSLAMDRLADFEANVDLIDLSAIDAIRGGTNNTFSWIGGADFSASGQVRYDAVTGVLQADTNDDRLADFQLLLIGKPTLSGADFIL